MEMKIAKNKFLQQILTLFGLLVNSVNSVMSGHLVFLSWVYVAPWVIS